MLNTKNPATKRLLSEAKELFQPTYHYWAQPSNGNLFEWHFSIRGPSDTSNLISSFSSKVNSLSPLHLIGFSEGIYHGRILLPSEYPFKPPHLILLTPNGRFKTNTKICLSITGFHPEYWQPSWTIRTILIALQSFFAQESEDAVGSIRYSEEERLNLARESVEWFCEDCGTKNYENLSDVDEGRREEIDIQIKMIEEKTENKSGDNVNEANSGNNVNEANSGNNVNETISGNNVNETISGNNVNGANNPINANEYNSPNNFNEVNNQASVNAVNTNQDTQNIERFLMIIREAIFMAFIAALVYWAFW